MAEFWCTAAAVNEHLTEEGEEAPDHLHSLWRILTDGTDRRKRESERERRVIPAETELEEKENEREAAKETRVLSRRISYKPRIEERERERQLWFALR